MEGKDVPAADHPADIKSNPAASRDTGRVVGGALVLRDNLACPRNEVLDNLKSRV